MTEQQADEAPFSATTFLNNSCKYILNDGLFDIDKYGPYIDKIRPFFVPTLENRIYWILEEFVYKEDSPLAKRFPYLKRCLDAAAAWTEPLCAKYKDANLAEETIRLTIKHLIKDGLIDAFVSSVVLNNRLNRICRELDALGIERNFLKNLDIPDFIHQQESSTDRPNSPGTRTLEDVNGSEDSDLEVEIGSRNGEIPRPRKRARKRAATYDSPSNANIDRREPPESQLHRASSQDSFRISEDSSRPLESEGNPFEDLSTGLGSSRKVHRSLCTLAYRVQHSTSDWKQARLKFIIRKVQTTNCNCGTMKAIMSCRLFLPCKLADLKDRILQADPILMELCLIVMKRKFENGLRHVCSCLNDILRRMNPREIKRLYVLCEIRASYIGFKLRPRDTCKCSACLLVVRVPICRSVRKRPVLRESFRDILQACDPASILKNTEDSSNEKISNNKDRTPSHSLSDSKTNWNHIPKTCPENNLTVSDDQVLSDHSVNLPSNDPRESSVDFDRQSLEHDSEKVISEVYPNDDNAIDLKVPDCICEIDENGDLRTKPFCEAINCIKGKSISRTNIEEDECRENSSGTADLRTEIFEGAKERNELYSAGVTDEEPREIISGLQSTLLTSLNSNEKLDTRERDSSSNCNKAISCRILFGEEENSTCLEKCLKIIKSSTWQDKYEPLIASGVKSILDLIFLEAKGRFQTLQQLNVTSYSVSVQTLEMSSPAKGETAESLVNIANVSQFEAKKRTGNLQADEYVNTPRELVDRAVSKTGKINVDECKRFGPENVCGNGECKIFRYPNKISMEEKNVKPEVVQDLSTNDADIFTKRCEEKSWRPELNSTKIRNHVEFGGTLVHNGSSTPSEKNYLPQHRKLLTIPLDLKKAKLAKTSNFTNHVDSNRRVQANTSRDNYRVRMYREEKRYRVSSLNLIRYEDLSVDRKRNACDKSQRSFSGKSINRIKQLIHAKLSRIFPERNKATNTSKTFLRNDKYLVSVLKAKASRACQGAFTSSAKSSDDTAPRTREDSIAGIFCPARRLLGGSERHENSIRKNRPNVDLKSPGSCSENRGKLSRNVCAECLKRNTATDLVDASRRSMNRDNGKRGKIPDNQQRLRNLRHTVAVNRDLMKIHKKPDHVRTFRNPGDRETSSSTLTQFRCCDKENYDHSSVSSETFRSHRRTLRSGEKSQAIRTRLNDWTFSEGNVNQELEELYRYKYVNNLSSDFRMKLTRYVNLCKSVRCSLLDRLRPDDIYQVSTTSIPAAYADRT